MYVVMFATLLFGVITVSFARIILSEATQSSNDDLSRSAYDAAMAGVEDAKIMVNNYYNCIKDPTKLSYCNDRFNIFSSRSNWNCDNGFPLAQLMHGVSPSSSNPTGEVLLQESNTSSSETYADQAYTCVLVSDITPDYRGTLSSDTRTRVIPIGITRNTNDSSELSNLNSVKKVRFSWYSDLNRGSTNSDFANLGHGGAFQPKEDATVPPTMQLSFIHFKSGASIADQYHKEDTGSHYSTMVFLPVQATDTSVTEVSSGALTAAGNATKNVAGTVVSETHDPFLVNCSAQREFACIVDIDVSGVGMGNNDSAFLVASLPYGDAYTDFSVTLFSDNNATTSIDFKGVQVSVDSTGRTNQLVRRVETRLDPADLFFPYPQYALELNGSDQDSLGKNFWITTNCWYSNPATSESGTCDNNGKFESSYSGVFNF